MLRPKKPKTIFDQVADDLKLNQDMVADIGNHFWSVTRESLSRLKHIRVHIENFGDFTIKHWLIDKELAKKQAAQEMNEQKGEQKANNIYKTAEKYYDLLQLKKQYEEEMARKEFIENHKKTAYANKQGEPTQGMEE